MILAVKVLAWWLLVLVVIGLGLAAFAYLHRMKWSWITDTFRAIEKQRRAFDDMERRIQQKGSDNFEKMLKEREQRGKPGKTDDIVYFNGKEISAVGRIHFIKETDPKVLFEKMMRALNEGDESDEELREHSEDDENPGLFSNGCPCINCEDRRKKSGHYPTKPHPGAQKPTSARRTEAAERLERMWDWASDDLPERTRPDDTLPIDFEDLDDLTRQL